MWFCPSCGTVQHCFDSFLYRILFPFFCQVSSFLRYVLAAFFPPYFCGAPFRCPSPFFTVNTKWRIVRAEIIDSFFPPPPPIDYLFSLFLRTDLLFLPPYPIQVLSFSPKSIVVFYALYVIRPVSLRVTGEESFPTFPSAPPCFIRPVCGPGCQGAVFSLFPIGAFPLSSGWWFPFFHFYFFSLFCSSRGSGDLLGADLSFLLRSGLAISLCGRGGGMRSSVLFKHV